MDKAELKRKLSDFIKTINDNEKKANKQKHSSSHIYDKMKHQGEEEAYSVVSIIFWNKFKKFV